MTRRIVAWAFMCGINVGWFFDYETLTHTDWTSLAEWPVVPMAGALLGAVMLRTELSERRVLLEGR